MKAQSCYFIALSMSLFFSCSAARWCRCNDPKTAGDTISACNRIGGTVHEGWFNYWCDVGGLPNGESIFSNNCFGTGFSHCE